MVSADIGFYSLNSPQTQEIIWTLKISYGLKQTDILESNYPINYSIDKINIKSPLQFHSVEYGDISCSE